MCLTYYFDCDYIPMYPHLFSFTKICTLKVALFVSCLIAIISCYIVFSRPLNSTLPLGPNFEHPRLLTMSVTLRVDLKNVTPYLKNDYFFQQPISVIIFWRRACTSIISKIAAPRTYLIVTLMGLILCIYLLHNKKTGTPIIATK